MRNVLLCFFCAFFMLISCSRDTSKLKRSSVLATLNDRIITVGEFEDFFLLRAGPFIEGVQAPELLRIKYFFLEQLIDELIILEIAQRERIEITDAQVDEEFNRIRAQFESEQLFEQFLRQRKLTSHSFKQLLRRTWTIRLVEEKKVYENINITDKETYRYYFENQAQYNRPENIDVKELVFTSLEDAEETVKRLKNGESFDDIYFTIVGRIDDNQLKNYTREELPQHFAQELFALVSGRTSQILESEHGTYHIFRVERRNNARQIDYQSVKDVIRMTLLMQKRELRYNQWINNIKKNAYTIEINQKYFRNE